jgi:hypothetical protein
MMGTGNLQHVSSGERPPILFAQIWGARWPFRFLYVLTGVGVLSAIGGRTPTEEEVAKALSQS